MLRLLGGDAVGMSTVPEVIAARHAGIEIFGLSVIVNLAAGLADSTLDHKEVTEQGKEATKNLTEFLKLFIKKMS